MTDGTTAETTEIETMTGKNLLITITISLLFCACTKTMYSDFQSVPITGWQEDSIISFSVPVNDTTSIYDIILCVRHTETYPYQNMWLFCGFGVDSLAHDTIEFFLADDRGRWLGNGGNKWIEMPVLYEQNYQFPDTGQYIFTVQHGMRDENLRGISDVGLIIRQSK